MCAEAVGRRDTPGRRLTRHNSFANTRDWCEARHASENEYYAPKNRARVGTVNRTWRTGLAAATQRTKPPINSVLAGFSHFDSSTKPISSRISGTPLVAEQPLRVAVPGVRLFDITCGRHLDPARLLLGQPRQLSTCRSRSLRLGFGNYAFAAALPPCFAFRRAAQYFRIRSPTAFRAAADIRRRLRCGFATSISRALAGIAGLAADPNGKWRNAFRSSAISASSSLIRASAPFLASSIICAECLGMSCRLRVWCSVHPFVALLVLAFDF